MGGVEKERESTISQTAREDDREGQALGSLLLIFFLDLEFIVLRSDLKGRKGGGGEEREVETVVCVLGCGEGKGMGLGNGIKAQLKFLTAI